MDSLESSKILEPWEITDFRESPIASLFPLLRSGIYHRTSPISYKQIMQEGFINPNQGEYPFTYPQSKAYYAHNKGYISLFDFESTSEEYCVLIHLTWQGFFFQFEPFTVTLKLNRAILNKKLIPNNAAPKLGELGHKGYIPYVEAWYPEPIPVSAIEGGILILKDQGMKPAVYQQFNQSDLQEAVHDLLSLWEQAQTEQQ